MKTFGLFASLLALSSAAGPPAPDVGEKIRAELQGKLARPVEACAELAALVYPSGTRLPLTFEVAPTGALKVSTPAPADSVVAYHSRCVTDALAGVKVSTRNFTGTFQLELVVPPPKSPGDGYTFFADDPQALDRETVLVNPRHTWLRCERGDATLTHQLDTADFAKQLSVITSNLAPTGPNADAGPLWKISWLKGGSPNQLARRSEIPAIAHTLELVSGLQRLCAPVRKLGDELPKLLEQKEKTLGSCLKHRHNELWIALTLDNHGEVSKADARATSGLDDKALTCLEKKAGAWSFPFQGTGRVTLSAHLQAAPPGE